MSSLLSNIRTLWALKLFFKSRCDFKNKTPDMPKLSDFDTECYMGGGGQIYNMVSDKQSILYSRK